MPMAVAQLEQGAARRAGHRVPAWRHAAHQRPGEGGEAGGGADAGEHHAGQDVADVVRVIGDGHDPPRRPGGAAEAADGDEPAVADAVGEPAGHGGQERRDRRRRRQPEAGGERRPAPHGDEERRHQHQPAERRAGEQHLRDVGHREAADAEQVEVEQRVGVACRADEEHRQEQRRADERAIVFGLFQPQSSPWTTPSTSSPMATAASGTEIASNDSLSSRRDSRSTRRPAMSAAIDERQVDEEHRPPPGAPATSSAPIVGATAPPSPATPPHTPIAIERRCTGNSSSSRASEAG